MKCKGTFPSHELFAVVGGRVCGACQVDDDTLQNGSLGKHPLMIGGFIGVTLPLVFSMSTSNYQSANGVVTHFEYRDWPAVLGGAIAMLCGLLLGVGILRKTIAIKSAGLGAAVAILLIGGFHIARGLGAFATPG